MSSQKVVIIGGGIIGLSIAEDCLRHGGSPVVLDRGPFAKEASWAGAGYLDLRSSSRVGGAFFELCRRSFELFPDWAARLKKESGLDPEYLLSGSLDVAFTEEEEASIKQMEGRLKGLGFPGQWVAPREAVRIEPQIFPGVRSAFFLPETSQVRPPRLTRALLKVLQKGGASLREVEPIEDFVVEGNRVKGVKTAKGLIEGDQFVMASGAWSGLLAEKLNVRLAVKPHRGQVLMLRTPPGSLKHILFTGLLKAFTYLVPRLDGHLYVGSTLEDVGFEKATTSEGMEKLKGGVAKLLPGLSNLLIEDSWSGLRPGSVDGWPYLGKAPGLEGLWIATGHFTHGLLLSAVTGQLMGQALRGEKTAMDLASFAVDRQPHPLAGI